MQIDGGKNDMFVAWADSGALSWATGTARRWRCGRSRKKYTLADNFFMGGFGGSFFNHHRLICACAPYYPDADTSPAKPTIAVVESDGVTLKAADNSPKSAMDGMPKFVSDGNLTPDFYAVNTMQPPYQPSGNLPAEGGDPAYADPAEPTTLPPQTETTIGDLLSAKGVSWAWYGGAWQAVARPRQRDAGAELPVPPPAVQLLCELCPGHGRRAPSICATAAWTASSSSRRSTPGKLPQVAFYKPQGNLNEHSGYADIASRRPAHRRRDRTIWRRARSGAHMLVVVTYDENGGIWDHVAPPKGDRWGPGTRIPAIIVSPFAKRGYVDHTPYDTTSILRFITRRFDLPTLDGIKSRDAAIAARGQQPLGDLTGSLNLL